MRAARQNYHDRMQRTLDHIDRHIDEDLDLEAVSAVAAFSKFHFHRQFTAIFYRVANGEQIRAGSIPGGRCAVLRVVGSTDDLEPAALYLYRDWLPTSGEEVRDFPLYCQRLAFFPDVAEHEAVAELFLPLK